MTLTAICMLIHRLGMRFGAKGRRHLMSRFISVNLSGGALLTPPTGYPQYSSPVLLNI